MQKYKKDLLRPYWNENLDYLPLGAKWRGKYQKRQVKRLIQEIDERALDIEVAEKVFGYKVEIIEVTEYNEDGSQTDHPELGFKHEYQEYFEPFIEEIRLPNYSTNFEDSRRIIDYFYEKGWNFSVNFYGETKEYTAEIKFQHEIGRFYLLDETPELAICAAALRCAEYAK